MYPWPKLQYFEFLTLDSGPGERQQQINYGDLPTYTIPFTFLFPLTPDIRDVKGGATVLGHPGQDVLVQDCKVWVADPVSNQVAPGFLGVLSLPQEVVGSDVSKDESRDVEVIKDVVDWWCVALTTSWGGGNINIPDVEGVFVAAAGDGYG